MATHQFTASDPYTCPKCGGALLSHRGSWGCETCRYAPPHGAD